MSTMKVAVFSNVSKIEIIDIEKPQPKPHEILVKMKACAICTWEQRVYRGINKVEFPFVGGHEMSGVIEALGDSIDHNAWEIGDKVVIGLLNSCGECKYCKMGEEGACENFSYEKLVGGLSLRGMGGFSEYLSVPAKNVFKMAEDLPFEVASLTEPLSCVSHSVDSANIKITDIVVVQGAGIMGQFHTMLSKYRAAMIIVIEPNEARRIVAKQLGADLVLDPMAEDVVQKVKRVTNGRGADIVFNTTAVSEIAQQSIQMVAKMGQVILYSSYHPDNPIDVSPNWIHKSMIKLTGSANSNTVDFKKSLRILSSKTIDPSLLISDCISFENIEEAFQKAIDPKNYRVIVTFS